MNTLLNISQKKQKQQQQQQQNKNRKVVFLLWRVCVRCFIHIFSFFISPPSSYATRNIYICRLRIVIFICTHDHSFFSSVRVHKHATNSNLLFVNDLMCTPNHTADTQTHTNTHNSVYHSPLCDIFKWALNKCSLFIALLV